MTNKTLAMGALLVWLAGCKAPPITHAGEAFEPFVLLDAGAQPRAPLRYSVPEGTVSRVAMRVDATTTGTGRSTRFLLGLRSGSVELVAGPAEATDQGVRFPFEVARVETEGTTPEDITWAKSLVGAGAVVETDSRGNVVWSETNELAAKLPARTRLAIVTASFGLLHVVLPDSPVGLGAKWQINARVAILGFTSVQQMTYSWIDRIGDELIIRLDYEERGLPQEVDFVGERAPIRAESLEISAEGVVRLNLHEMMSSAAASGSAREELAVDQDGTEREVTVEEAFRITADAASTNLRRANRR